MNDEEILKEIEKMNVFWDYEHPPLDEHIERIVSRAIELAREDQLKQDVLKIQKLLDSPEVHENLKELLERYYEKGKESGKS